MAKIKLPSYTISVPHRKAKSFTEGMRYIISNKKTIKVYVVANEVNLDAYSRISLLDNSYKFDSWVIAPISEDTSEAELSKAVYWFNSYLKDNG